MWLLLVLACTGSKTGESACDTGCGGSTITGPGRLVLSFAMEADYISTMEEPPVGTVYGSIFHDTDVTGAGPNDGAVAIEDITVENVDLSSEGGPTAELYTSGDLDPENVWILGCLDSDGSGECDKGDPVTYPNDNHFAVVSGTDTSVQMFFGLLNPS